MFSIGRPWNMERMLELPLMFTSNLIIGFVVYVMIITCLLVKNDLTKLNKTTILIASTGYAIYSIIIWSITSIISLFPVFFAYKLWKVKDSQPTIGS
jgi:hypothetical protein